MKKSCTTEYPAVCHIEHYHYSSVLLFDSSAARGQDDPTTILTLKLLQLLWCCCSVIMTVTVALQHQSQVESKGHHDFCPWPLKFLFSRCTNKNKVVGKDKYINGEGRRTCQQFTQLGQTAYRCCPQKEEITSASGITAGFWCSSTAHWDNCGDLREEAWIEWSAPQHRPSLYRFNNLQFCLWGSYRAQNCTLFIISQHKTSHCKTRCFSKQQEDKINGRQSGENPVSFNNQIWCYLYILMISKVQTTRRRSYHLWHFE